MEPGGNCRSVEAVGGNRNALAGLVKRSGTHQPYSPRRSFAGFPVGSASPHPVPTENSYPEHGRGYAPSQSWLRAWLTDATGRVFGNDSMHPC